MVFRTTTIKILTSNFFISSIITIVIEVSIFALHFILIIIPIPFNDFLELYPLNTF